MKKSLLLLFLSFPILVAAQEIQWASKVLRYSSDPGGKINGIKKILGSPDAFPQGGPSPNAWIPKDALGRGFVEVEFENAQLVNQIVVFENLNAGSVSRVQVSGTDGKFRTVVRKVRNYESYGSIQKSNADRSYYFNKKRRKVEIAPDVSFNAAIEYFILEKPESNVKMVRVEFNFGLVAGEKQIDAIGISNSEAPVNVTVDALDGSEMLVSETVLVSKFPDQQYAYPSFLEDNKLVFSVFEDGQKRKLFQMTGNGSEYVPETRIESDDQMKYIQGYIPGNKTVMMGNKPFYTATGRTGYSFYTLKDGKYIFNNELVIAAFTNYSDNSDAFIAPDGQYVLMGIESDQTQGGEDVYVSKAKPDGTFGYLQNLGKVINTAADEGTPFLFSDNKTLLYASNGMSGYGNFDIYVSIRLDDSWTKWSKPKNLGPIVNGQSYDLSPYYDEKNEVLYTVTMRDGFSNIRKVKLPRGMLRKAY